MMDTELKIVAEHGTCWTGFQLLCDRLGLNWYAAMNKIALTAAIQELA